VSSLTDSFSSEEQKYASGCPAGDCCQIKQTHSEEAALPLFKDKGEGGLLFSSYVLIQHLA